MRENADVARADRADQRDRARAEGAASRKCAGASSSRTSSRSWRARPTRITRRGRRSALQRSGRRAQPLHLRVAAGGSPQHLAQAHAARARAAVSSCHGALSTSRPLPFMRSGESSGRTSSSATQRRLRRQRRGAAVERLQRAAQLDRIPQRVTCPAASAPGRRAARRWRCRIPPAALRTADRSAPGRARSACVADPRRQQRLHRGVAVAFVHGHARIVARSWSCSCAASSGLQLAARRCGPVSRRACASSHGEPG